MEEKTKVLLKAMQEMKKLSEFHDNVRNLLGLQVLELQPSETAGVLFDMLVDQLLTDDGVDLLNEFMFGGVPDEYGEEKPFVITASDNPGLAVKIEIKNCEAMCQFLEKNKYFKE